MPVPPKPSFLTFLCLPLFLSQGDTVSYAETISPPPSRSKSTDVQPASPAGATTLTTSAELDLPAQAPAPFAIPLASRAVSSIDEWLESIGLQAYASKIKDYGCDSLQALDDASEQDMKDMTQDPDIGMKKLHCALFMNAWYRRAASKDFSDLM